MARPKSLGSYAPLSSNYYRDDAILEAGEKAELLFVRGLAYCAESTSDGFITDRQLLAVVALGMRDAAKRAGLLVNLGLWERVEGGYVVRSWLKWNKSAEDIGRALKRDRERKATPKDEGIPADSGRNPDGIQTDSVPRVRGRAPEALHDTTRHDTQPARNGSAAPAGETVGQRGNRLAKTYTDVVKLSNFPAVAGVVRKAINAGHDDEAITDALARLADEGRSVTTDTLRVELEGLPASRYSRPEPQAPAHIWEAS